VRTSAEPGPAHARLRSEHVVHADQVGLARTWPQATSAPSASRGMASAWNGTGESSSRCAWACRCDSGEPRNWPMACANALWPIACQSRPAGNAHRPSPVSAGQTITRVSSTRGQPRAASRASRSCGSLRRDAHDHRQLRFGEHRTGAGEFSSSDRRPGHALDAARPLGLPGENARASVEPAAAAAAHWHSGRASSTWAAAAGRTAGDTAAPPLTPVP